MKPIVLIHGYSSDGKNNTVEDIYGTLPSDLKRIFGDQQIVSLNLARWISLNDGIRLDDVSFAMDRALRSHPLNLLGSGFHVVIHSTGALVVRNWIKNYSPKPSPIANLVHLAGANFGSGLAHIGKGQLARWGRHLFMGTGSGCQILDELEFGAWKTLDMHLYFLEKGNVMLEDYQVQEFCIAGSQIPAALRALPIRYVKEDSCDNTVRTSAVNLNLNYVSVQPLPDSYRLPFERFKVLLDKRKADERIIEENYAFNLDKLAANRPRVPFSIVYDTAHFGDEIGIVSGSKNRQHVLPLIQRALETPVDVNSYQQVAAFFDAQQEKVFERVASRKSGLPIWNLQSQYEAHAQLIFRLRDQFGEGIEHFDITLRTRSQGKGVVKIESMIEDNHSNSNDFGTMTFYLRTQRFTDDGKWENLLEQVAAVNVEITATELKSADIAFLPLTIELSAKQVRTLLQNFRTTLIDVTLLRLPSGKVFSMTQQ